ncbi:hypothetical protein BWP39_27595 [Paraburkholderia acidicola]|uniref:Uncharacterized protein n=1 Tax=Paraburkholderia acidicola TaxID=1912599 RepID=A0A2A4ETF8_9BURK|nr:hypothetical protein BWP39_27595 [Paraburkholderia acidicola]
MKKHARFKTASQRSERRAETTLYAGRRMSASASALDRQVQEHSPNSETERISASPSGGARVRLWDE